MTIYIQTTIAGQTISKSILSEFKSRLDYWAYADEVLAFNDVVPLRSDTIEELCDQLVDNGAGSGSRFHQRASRIEAKAAIRAGAKNGCWSI